MTTTKRARKGGEIAPNGEFYKGGQFINTIEENPKRHAITTKATGKREVAPYVWEVAPNADARSIYKRIAGVYGRVEDGRMVLNINHQTLAYYGDTMEEITALCDQWNAGNRWY